MSKAKITLLGMYRWMSENNDDLFYNLSTPTGIDKQKLINTILMNGAEFEVLYSDADFMKFLIGVWSDKWQRTMEKWIEVLSMDYNPIENYDRKEDWMDSTNRQTSASNTSSEDAMRNEASKKSETAFASDNSKATGDGTTTNEVSPYDATTYVAHDKSTSSTGGTNDASSITDARAGVSDTILDTRRGNGSEDTLANESGLHTGRIHGNIGVKTTQSMVQEEIDISKFNIYDEISNLFLTEFVIYTY